MKGKQFKVKFTAKGGFDFDKEQALKVLKIDDWYTVISVKVSDWTTDLYLDGINGGFNSCLFEQSDDIERAILENSNLPYFQIMRSV